MLKDDCQAWDTRSLSRTVPQPNRRVLKISLKSSLADGAENYHAKR